MICPHCYSDSTKKNGLRKNATGEKMQSWHCNSCGRNFSESVKNEEIIGQNVRLAKQKQALEKMHE